jgi:hypothetical protein
MRHPLAFVLSCLCLASGSPARAQDITFAFTDLTSCTREVPRDPAAEESGQDEVIVCAGPGGAYTVTEFYSAFDAHRSVSSKEHPDFELRLTPTQVKCPFTSYGKNLEWRLKDGKPFAVIQRVTCLGFNETETGPGKKLAEYLLVRGLKGHEAINGLVNTKTKGANEKARALADAGLGRP